MTAEELYAMEAETGRTSEWEPLYRAEKRRADAAEAEAQRAWSHYEAAVSEIALVHMERDQARESARIVTEAKFTTFEQMQQERDAAEAAVARVRTLLGEDPFNFVERHGINYTAGGGVFLSCRERDIVAALCGTCTGAEASCRCAP